MGNKNTKGNLLIACDYVSVQSGSEIVGHIYLQLNKKIKKKVSLSLVFTGSEQIEWNTGILDMKKEKKRFRKEKKDVYIWDSGLAQGQYDFPFEFLLDNEIIPTFSAKEEKYGAQIEYYLHAIILGKGIKLKNSAKIEILQKGVVERVPLGMFKELTYKQCCKKHIITLKGQLNSNIYYSDENLTFELTYNSRDYSLKDIKVALTRKLLLKSSEGSKHFQKNIFSKTFPLVFPGRAISGTFNLVNHCDTLSKGKALVSNLISCKYFLIISHSTDSLCSQILEPVEYEIPIFSNKSYVIPSPIESPNDWNPQSYPLARMTFKDFKPSAPDYIEDN